jgi:hypothetical protein
MLRRFHRLGQILQKLLRRDPEPQDPYAYVGVPLRKGPSGRSSAIALTEPDEPSRTLLFGKKK